MAELRKCSRCRSVVELKYFDINRKGEYNKTCSTCLSKKRHAKSQQTTPNDLKPLKRTDTDFVDGVVSSDTSYVDPHTVVLDVEHSGSKESYIIQFSWGLYDDNGSLLRMNDYYVKPHEYIYINPYVSKITGLTYDSLLAKPNSLPIKDLLNRFTTDVRHCKKLVAHNMASDISTINKELTRNGFQQLSPPTYCTMANSKKYCNLKDKLNRIKNPRLDELHAILFDVHVDTSKTHNSCYDVELCAKCYFKLIKDDIDINSTHVKKTDEEASTAASESDALDDQCKHRCSIDATDIATLVGHHKHETNVYKMVMKYWERGFKDDYLTMHSNLFDHETEKKEAIDDTLTQTCEEHNIPLNFDKVEQVEHTVNQLIQKCEEAQQDVKLHEQVSRISDICKQTATSKLNTTSKQDILTMCKIITDTKHIEEVQRIIDICDKDDESDVEGDDELVEDSQPKNNTDVELVSSVCDKINERINFANKLLANIKPPEVESFANKQMGICLEKTAVELYEEKYKVNVKPLRRYVKKVFNETPTCKWFIGGRVDGVQNCNTVVEVKNRRYKAFSNIPIYEKIQINSYMYIMGLNHSVLIQKYMNDITTTNFTYEYSKWWYENVILRKLNKFCEFMDSFICNSELKESFMLTETSDTDMINKHNEMLKKCLNL